MRSATKLNVNFALAAVLVSTFGASAFSAQPETTATAANAVHGVTVEIPPTDVTNGRDVIASPDSPQLEFAVSSWSPRALGLVNGQGVGGTFQSGGVPDLSMTMNSPILSRGKLGLLSWRLGAGVFAMTRDGYLTFSGVQQPETESLYLVSVRAGVEYEPAIASTSWAAPYLQAAFLPTLAVAPRSGLSGGNSVMGLPGEFGLGYALKPHFLDPIAQINLGATMTVGSLQGQSLYGVGFVAGARVAL